MEIDDTEIRWNERSMHFLLDVRNSACFKCHKPGCCPRKHPSEAVLNFTMTNVEAALAAAEGISVNSDVDSSKN